MIAIKMLKEFCRKTGKNWINWRIALLEKETLYAEEIYQLLDITPRAIHSFS